MGQSEPRRSDSGHRYEIVERPPSVSDYKMLRDAVGWGNIADEPTRRALGNALYSVCLRCDGETIGCGRVLGDGGEYFYVQDVIVLPAHQGRGLGHQIMERLLGYLEAHATKGAFVGLMAASGVEAFYERYGFKRRPTDRPGMLRIW